MPDSVIVDGIVCWANPISVGGGFLRGSAPWATRSCDDATLESTVLGPVGASRNGAEKADRSVIAGGGATLDELADDGVVNATLAAFPEVMPGRFKIQCGPGSGSDRCQNSGEGRGSRHM